MNKQLLQRALDALEKNLQSLVFGVTFDMTQAAIEELRAAIDAVAPYHMPDAGNMVAQPAQPRLKVRLTSFPESNGKRNWTALLVREKRLDGLVGNCGGVSLARGELWNRVAWEAECARYLIGERDTEPSILDYGHDIETPDQWPGETHGRHRSRQGA